MTHGKICAKCGIELRCKENGVIALSMGIHRPLEAYSADLWHCPACGWEGIIGIGANPIKVHWDHDWKTWLAHARETETVIEFWLNMKERAQADLRRDRVIQ